jgi:Rrf2 family protein
MQLTRAADYAVRVMIHLASQPEGAVVPKALLAVKAEAPDAFLSKILQSLARAGLIQARRGVEGGFSLLPHGAQSSLLDVVEAIDGPIALNVCVTSGTACHRQAECPAHGVWLRAQAAMVSVLREAKIAEMIPKEEARSTLLKINKVTSSGETESKQASQQGKPALKSGNTARPQSAPTGALRRAIEKQNIKK